jgi:hypothetical protein
LYYTDPYGLFGMDDVWGGVYSATGGWSPSQTTVDIAAGFGDGVYSSITLGLGNLQDIRDIAGIDGGVDQCSNLYKGFNTTGKVVGGFALGGAVGKGINKLTGGYGVTLGPVSGLYSLPSIGGMTWLNISTRLGRFAIQTGNWGKSAKPFYKQLYLKLPGKTNKHWPWQR